MKLIQNVQEMYAFNTNMTVLILDKSGCPITDPSNATSLVRLVLEKYGSNYEQIINEFCLTDKGIIYDGLFGLKQLFVPIFTQGNRLAYFIWGGILIEEGTKSHIIKYLEDHSENDPMWIEAIKPISEVTTIDKENKLLQLEQMAEICAAIIQGNTSVEQFNKRRDVLNQIDPNFTVSNFPQIVDGLLQACSELDFVGLATNLDSAQYEITHFNENNGVELVKNKFSVGEGFLGQAAARGQFSYWADIESDPRSTLFLNGEDRPRHLFGVPIYKNKKIINIIFGGSFSQSLTQQTKLLIELIKKLSEAQFENQYLMSSKGNLIIRLTTLLEVSQVLTEYQDKKRILFTLVDMSLNLVQGPFSCVILKNESGNANVVSRGLTSEQLQSYGKNISERYFDSGISKSGLMSPEVQTTGWNIQVLEIPIFFRDNLYGMLCVGLNKMDDVVELQTLLSSLALMGAVAIDHQQTSNTAIEENKLVNSLHSSMKQWNPRGYEHTKEAKQLTSSFAKHLNFSETDIFETINASLLVHYDSEILTDAGVEENIVELVRAFQAKKASSEKVEILLLVFSYLNMESLTEIKNELVLNKKFIDFLNKSQVMDEDIAITTEPVHHEQRVTDIIDFLKKEKLLTTREVEVLKVIIQGLNNREIADQLYISEHTVKNHVTNIFHKLDVQDRTQAIALVYQGGQKNNR